MDFETFLKRARRWRKEYAPAKARGNFDLMRELESLLCRLTALSPEKEVQT